MNLEDKIRETLEQYSVGDFLNGKLQYDEFVKDLLTLFTEEKAKIQEEAIRGFIEWQHNNYRIPVMMDVDYARKQGREMIEEYLASLPTGKDKE